MNNEMLVNTIRALCKANNVSISQLENDLEFGAGLVSRWIKSSPSIDKIVDIAGYFHVSLDDVVGYHATISDKFLEKLILETGNENVNWNKYDNSNKEQPKQFVDEDIESCRQQKNIFQHVERQTQLSYFTKINNSYISLYGHYENYKIIKPLEIKLFIQPDGNSKLIEQDYTYEQLKSLWLKVLFSLNDEAPDEIKAEEFKNAFINDF